MSQGAAPEPGALDPAGPSIASSAQAPPSSGKKKSELRTRLILGPLMLALIGCVYWADTQGFAGTPGRLSACVLGLLAVGGVLEYSAMMGKGGFPLWSSGLLVVTAALCAVAPWLQWSDLHRALDPLVISAFAVLVPACFLSLTKSRMQSGLELQGATVLGLILLAWPMYLGQGICMQALPTLVYVVLVCKGGDIGGYLIGMSMGRRKLIPHISPGKTIEGSLGSLAVSLGLAVALRTTFLQVASVPPTELGQEPTGAAGAVYLLSVPWALVAGLLLNVAAQSGDLVESLLKRRCGVKDSSTLLPAHGGILDLVDSLLFALPAWFLILALCA